jgi:hypothetical protein
MIWNSPDKNAQTSRTFQIIKTLSDLETSKTDIFQIEQHPNETPSSG